MSVIQRLEEYLNIAVDEDSEETIDGEGSENAEVKIKDLKKDLENGKTCMLVKRVAE